MITPITAIMRCADLARASDPSHRSHFVTVDIAPDKSGVIAATNGCTALRFAFDAHTFTNDHDPGRYSAPAAHFPKWGKARWAFGASAPDNAPGALTFEAYNAKGTTRAPKRDRVVVTHCDRTNGVAIRWEQVTRGPRIEIPLNCGRLSDALEVLHEDAEVCLYRQLDYLMLGAGQLDGPVGKYPQGPNAPITFARAGYLEDILESFEGCGGATAIHLPISDPLAPIVITTLDKGASGLVMPRSK